MKNSIHGLFYFFCMIIVVNACSANHSTDDRFEVEIMAYDYAFDAPSEIPNGWITFILNNQMSHEVHEISFARIPEEISYSEYLEEYVGAWEILLEELQQQDIERTEIPQRANELLPDWAGSVQYINARGLISEGRIAEKTIYLEPGNYALDCWVKSPDGVIHLSSGMTRNLTVTDEPANSSEPVPESQIIIHENRIEIDWEPSVGEHAFAVNLTESNDGTPAHNNIHLIRIDDDTNPDYVNNWMDWYRTGGKGLAAPAPAIFLGGMSTYDSVPGEQATYFSLTIDEPGEYAWIVNVIEGNPLWESFEIVE